MRKLYELFIVGGIATSSPLLALAQGQPVPTSNPIEDFFYGVNAKNAGTDKDYPAYEAMLRATQTMTPSEIAVGLAVIDRKIDASIVEPQDYFTKGEAVMLLGYIGARPDGAELVASQMDRLAYMLNEPDHRFTVQAFEALKLMGPRLKQLVVPVLKEALENPAVNNKTGPGSGISVLLLRLAPYDGDAAERVARYMRRPDMTDDHLRATIVGIDGSRVIPDAVTAELVRCLDRLDDFMKARALVDIYRSSPAAREAARQRIQRMASDPRETDDIRRLATGVLNGKIAEKFRS